MMEILKNIFSSAEYSVVLIAAILAFGASLISIILSNGQAKKTWHVSVASERRKERIEKFIVLYSKIVSLAHPNTIIEYSVKNEKNYVETVLEHSHNIDMLLDHRFGPDTRLAYLLERLVESALEYYIKNTTASCTTVTDTEYSEFYKTIQLVIRRDMNVFIGVEWTRVKNEVIRGKPIKEGWWSKQYFQDISHYDHWAEKLGVVLTNKLDELPSGEELFIKSSDGSLCDTNEGSA